MNRRLSLKTLVIISAGAGFLPSCFRDNEKSSLPLKNIKIDAGDEAILAELSDAIIPKTDTPGAKDVSVHLFALMMIDDCYPKGEQEKFVKGLKGFRHLADKQFDKTFIACSPTERAQLLTDIQNTKDAEDDKLFFYHAFKRLTIQAYTTSEYFLTKVQPYKLVPGEFYGCVPVKKTS